MDSEKKIHEKYYRFAVAELPRVKQALEALQPTGVDWLDSLFRMHIKDTIQGFEDTIEEFENRPKH
jgi:hypothetical protein